ncbi:MAG: helix-turn-helix transcriptional regulator [bacterium]|nr:helix-turn-helix transcriptional regulator [bacterium]
MRDKINKKMEEYKVSFGDLAKMLNISKQTLTKKVQGEMDWTFPEMEKLMEVFHIEDPQEFFFSA